MDTLQQFLGMLRNVQGPNASGNYEACCPAHEDKQASLSVSLGAAKENGARPIMVKCFRGCQYEQIIGALGLKRPDMYVGGNRQQGKSRKPAAKQDPEQPKADPAQPKPDQAQPVPGMTVHTVGGDEKKDSPKIDWNNPVRVYSYTDEHGQEVFQVVRYRYVNAPGKTFRQRRWDPKDPKANRDGWVNSVPDSVRDGILYRLPKVAEAIKSGTPVYVVEGEKDVETMERLGRVATCNAGGAGKWNDSYSRRLEGADVIILPDNDGKGNDFTGQTHSWNVALKLQDVAKRVRLVDIREACPELPEKGDITDMVEILGDTRAMDALARQVTATKDFSPDMVPFWLTPQEQAEKLYNMVKGYGVEKGAIVQKTGETTKALTDFVVLPREELTRDDGMQQSLWFVLDGWSSNGRKLGRVTVSANEMDSMNWVTQKWGFAANLMPGTATKGKVAWTIEKVGQLTAKRVVEYSHTGWRKIGGRWAYLYQGGAVGVDGVTVEMEGALKNYRLDGGGAEGFREIQLKEAILDSLQIQMMMAPSVGTALLGAMYLAPLREFLSQTDVVPAFALFLHGDSGTHKTTAASLALSHFGNFHTQQVPASFSDTGNQIRRKAFLLKDMPILVDDFHPTTSAQEKRQMNAVAQSLSRAFGDGSDRGRLNADRTLQASTPPRSVAIISGEDLPAVGASGLARFYIVNIEEGDIPVGDAMTEMQEKARKGVLQRAMRGYIQWLLQQMDGLPERLHKAFLQYREIARKQCTGAHDRAPAAVACLMVGYAMMLTYMRDQEVITDENMEAMLRAALHELTEGTRKQSRESEAERPARMFVDAAREMLASKRIYCKDLMAVDWKEPPPTVKMVGYMDQEFYYFLPELAYAEVVKARREQGVEFPISRPALYKQLVRDGYVQRTGPNEDTTRVKRIDGRNQRLLWIPRAKIDGVDEGTQVEIELPKEWQ